jgi:hypothetical protein
VKKGVAKRSGTSPPLPTLRPASRLDIRQELNREPTGAERHAAIISTAAQIASRRILTARANEAKTAQEELVRTALSDSGFLEVPARVISILRTAPDSGQFCGESMLGSRKADFVIGLWDDRILAIECKVSNSRINSVKRIKNDAAVKARLWIQEFGDRLIVPAAVISGVYHPPNLVSAQRDGLTIWWSHHIGQMITWIDRRRHAGSRLGRRRRSGDQRRPYRRGHRRRGGSLACCTQR